MAEQMAPAVRSQALPVHSQTVISRQAIDRRMLMLYKLL